MGQIPIKTRFISCLSSMELQSRNQLLDGRFFASTSAKTNISKRRNMASLQRIHHRKQHLWRFEISKTDQTDLLNKSLSFSKKKKNLRWKIPQEKFERPKKSSKF